MTAVLRPRGPQRASVYWRRRMVLLVAITVAVLTVGYLLASIGGSGSKADAAGEPSGTDATAQPSPEPTDGEPAEPAPTEAAPTEAAPTQAAPTPTPTPSPSASVPAVQAAPPAAAACSEDAVLVSVATDAGNYPATVDPKITMTIASQSESDCSRDIGSGANEIVITSGGHHVWSTNDCDPSATSNVQVLRPGDQAQVTITWPRTLSAPGCGGEATPAQPGTYQVEGHNGTVTSAPVRFTLE